MMNFKNASWEEICKELGARLKAARLSQNIQQTELATRAQVSRGAVLTLENTGQSTIESMARIVKALGLEDELQGLFSAPAAALEARGPAVPVKQRVRGPRKLAQALVDPVSPRVTADSG